MKTPQFPVATIPGQFDQPESHDSPEPRRRFGISFPVAFLIVLGLHCAGVAGIYAYSSIKPKPVVVTAAEPVEPVHGPKSDALAANEWPEPDAKPQVVATPTPPQVAQQSPRQEMARSKVAPPVTKRVVEAAPQKPSKVLPALPRKDSVARVDDSQELRKQFLAAAGKVEASHAKPAPVAKTATPAAGHSETPAPATGASPAVVRAQPVSPASPKSAPASVTKVAVSQYTLAPGDNLYMVSRKLGVSYQDLARANGISDPRQLRVGQTLKVPAVASL